MTTPAATAACGSPTARSPPASRPCGYPWAPASAAWWPRPRRRTRRPATSPTPVPAHRRHHRRRRRRGTGRDPRCSADPRLTGDRRPLRRRPQRADVRPVRGGAARLARRARGHRAGQRQAPGGDAGGTRGAVGRELRAHTASVERAAGAHDRFIDVVLRGGGVEDVAAAVTEALGGYITVLDQEGRVAPTDAAPGDDGLPPDPAAALTLARATGRTVRDGSWWTAAVTVDNELLGGLVLHRDDELSEADQRILERAALVTALLLLIRRTAGEAENRVRGELLEELLTSSGRDPEGLRERARRLGADLDRPQAVLVARTEERGRPRALAAATHLAATRGGLAAAHEGCIVVCLPDVEPGPGAALVCRELTAAGAGTVTVGGAGPVRGPGAVAPAHAVAARCAATLVALGRTGGSASAEELGFFGLLVGEGRDVHAFVEATLAPVLQYDARRGTGLESTLEAFFDCGGSPARAAEALRVHVNTVAQRLDRVARLLGRDWNSPARALEVQLALRLHRLTGALDQ